MKYVQEALEYADKSLSKKHQHGAVCVVGGKIVSGGCNSPEDPHLIKVLQ
jgi:deoxycytidylate deaminase